MKPFEMFPGHDGDRRRQYATAAMSAMCHGRKALTPDEVRMVAQTAFRVADEMMREEERAHSPLGAGGTAREQGKDAPNKKP